MDILHEIEKEAKPKGKVTINNFYSSKKPDFLLFLRKY